MLLNSRFWRPASRLALTATALASALLVPAARADVLGVLTDAVTGQPFPEGLPFVQLLSCLNTGDKLCSGWIAAVNPDASGAFRFDGSTLAPGSYQVTGWSDGHEQKRSKPFTITGTEDHSVNLALAMVPVTVSEIQGCETLEAGGYCTVHYRLTSQASEQLQLQVWAMVDASSAIPAGWSEYEWGNDSAKPMVVTLGAGKSKALSQRIYVGTGMPSGAYSSLSLFVSPKGKPQETLITEMLPTVLFTATGGGGNGLRIETDSRAKAQAMAAMKQARLVRKGWEGKAQVQAAASGKLTIYGQVIGADTGAALPVEDKPQVELMRCEMPDDTYCRWLQSDPATLDETGKFTVHMTNAPAGRYQLHVIAGAHYGQSVQPVFDLPGAEGTKLLKVTLPRLAIDLDAVERCTAAPADNCPMRYTLRNTTSQDISAAVWLYTYGVQSKSQSGTPIYDIGQNGKAHGQKILVTVPAGQTYDLASKLDLSDLAPGSTGWMRLFIGDPNDAAQAISYTHIGNYTVSAGAEGRTLTVVPRPDVIIH